MAPLKGKTEELGRFQLSGFYVLYRLIAQLDDFSKETDFHLDKGKQSYLTLKYLDKRISAPANRQF